MIKNIIFFLFSLIVEIISLITLPMKWNKTQTKGRKKAPFITVLINMFLLICSSYIDMITLSSILRLENFSIVTFYVVFNFFNITNGNARVKKFARLFHDCVNINSPLLQSLSMRKNISKICIVLSPLTNPPLTCEFILYYLHITQLDCLLWRIVCMTSLIC